MAANRGGMAEDRDGAPVFLARNAWELGYIAEKSPKIKVLRHPRALIVFRTASTPARSAFMARSSAHAEVSAHAAGVRALPD